MSDVTLTRENEPSSEAHKEIMFTTSAMAHTNYGELRQLFETFNRVGEAGEKTSLQLHTLLYFTLL